MDTLPCAAAAHRLILEHILANNVKKAIQEIIHSEGKDG